ncbi:MAG TPA: DUF4230 domain-containing protein [Thermoanaerobaculia bacterium]|nr:DUF4230 domain-containing protein [Thermoanaerobaculia bacterium]
MKRPQTWIILILLAVVIGGGLYISRELPRRVAEQITEPKIKEVDLGAVVTRIRGLNRLETASMHVMHVSTISQTYDFVPNAMAGDSLTFMATGDVIAGVDLALMRADDLRREPDGTVLVHLPPAQILVTRIDNRESRVVSRKTGLFRRADPSLESRARQYAEAGVRNEAVKKGILTLANTNAQARLAELLHGAGIERVEFVESSGLASATSAQ